MPHYIRPRLRYYKRSYSFNPQSRFPDLSAESTGGPASLHFARTTRALRCVSEASCPNFEPRAHARLTGLFNQLPGGFNYAAHAVRAGSVHVRRARDLEWNSGQSN